MFVTKFNINQSGRTRISGAPFGHDARILADIAVRSAGKPVVYVALDDLKASLIIDLLGFFAPQIEIINFPSWDCLPYDRISPHADISGARLNALMRLTKPFKEPAIVITTINALMQKNIPSEIIKDYSLDLSVGDNISVEKLISFLTSSGYYKTSTVHEVGEMAVRGGIIDLFPSGYDNPVRLDFFGDEIDSIRLFDPLTQVTVEKTNNLKLQPTSEVLLNKKTISNFRLGYRELFGTVTKDDPLYEAISLGKKFTGVEHWLPLFYKKLVSLLDYLPSSPIIFDYQSKEAINARLEHINDFYNARLSLYNATIKDKKKNKSVAIYKPVPSELLYFNEDDLEKILSNHAVADLSIFTEPEDISLDAKGSRGRNFSDLRTKEDSKNTYSVLKDYIKEQHSNGRRVVIACYSKSSIKRMESILKNHDINVNTDFLSWEEIRKIDIKIISIIVLGLENGFISPDLTVITEQDILGDRLVRKPKKRKTASQFQIELGNMKSGDFVVHLEHGVGRYEGLETIDALGTMHDCIKLIYLGGDKLFVPVENLDILTRYAGSDSNAVLDKLGGVAWQARKAKVKKRLLDMADDLLKIAAEREIKKAEIIRLDEASYQEFTSRFPYSETEDQLRSIESVLNDLSKGSPMDRLVCGDVGFGKTEIALRAAFAVASTGLQVVIVAPTTLLARQHHQNFVQRFSGFPIKIAQLSRMVSAKVSKETKTLLETGEIDIVIGTHAVLNKNIKFQRLGLVIIDEEQRFGVKQKEQLKNLRSNVHVLTLTATPIPRTLQLALTGVRELSLIATPPVDRLAVSTYVLPYDQLVIREALMREYYRGGQSFYVCPHIEDLDSIVGELKELTPELKLVTAHGRMNANQLDDIMNAFDDKKYDVLIATNIIESGLDIPNANTIILHRADRFGLAQLYQLRGRVGRAKQRGYAYFTYETKIPISKTAQQRLEVISTLDQLGAGFQLASHDMDIRGTGNLLGQEQSGHIREVGVELYQQMLEDAVAAAKAGAGEVEEIEEYWTPQINIGLSVLIPENYVKDLNIRLGLYKRLSDCETEDEVNLISEEMIDRFGDLPKEVKNLLEIMSIKQLCRSAGVSKIDAGAKGAVISFYKDKFSNPTQLIMWITNQAGTVKVRPDQKMIVIRAWDNIDVRIDSIKKLLKELISLK